ncbi:hypothetical protein GCM10027592_56320 [Spirosoma flavus]
MYLKVRASLYTENSLRFLGPAFEEFRFSYWKKGHSHYMSSGKIVALPEGAICLGETKVIDIIVIDGPVSTTLQIGEIIEIGAAQSAIGLAEILEINENRVVI